MQKRVSRVWIYLLCALVAVLVAELAIAEGGDRDQRVERRIVIERLHGFEHGGTFLGVHLTALTSELRSHFGVPEDVGVMVSRVESESPAERAGLQVGDIITRVGGEDVGSTQELAREVRGRDDGETVDLEVWRDGRVEILSATLEQRQPALRGGSGETQGLGLHRLMAFCGAGEECGFTADCDQDDCQCTVNGEEVDCQTLHGLHLDRLRRHQQHDG